MKSCLGQEVCKLLSIHPSYYRRVKNKASSCRNGECDSQTYSSLPTDLPVCSFSSYRSALASSCPYVVTRFIDENCVAYDSLAIAVVMRFCVTSGRFRSAGWRLAILKRNSIPSRVLATVRSWILGFRRRRRLSSWFICAKVNIQLSFKISFRQSFISLSTRTLLAPPRGLSAIRPSRIYLATMLLAVDLLTPMVSATIR